MTRPKREPWRSDVTKLIRASNNSLANTNVKNELKRIGLLPNPMSPEKFAEFMREDMAKWLPIVAAAKVSGEK